MILALEPWTSGWEGVLWTGPPAMPAPPDPAAWAAGAQTKAVTAIPEAMRCLTRKSSLFLKPAGLAVGLALKELRLPRVYRGTRPSNWVPRSASSAAGGLGVAAI